MYAVAPLAANIPRFVVWATEGPRWSSPSPSPFCRRQGQSSYCWLKGWSSLSGCSSCLSRCHVLWSLQPRFHVFAGAPGTWCIPSKFPARSSRSLEGTRIFWALWLMLEHLRILNLCAARWLSPCSPVSIQRPMNRRRLLLCTVTREAHRGCGANLQSRPPNKRKKAVEASCD